jgi:hypothetical protein
MAKKDFEQLYKEKLDNDKALSIQFWIIDEVIERQVEWVLSYIFEKFNKAEFVGVVYTCIKELLNNAAKANLKRILFMKGGQNIDNEEEYLKAMMKFKDQLIEKNYRTYLEELKKHNYWIVVKFYYNNNGLCIEVVNHARITKIEDKRLREKLKKAMNYEDIVQFYLEQGDEIEGAGMGIALIVILLKGMGLDPSLFRIGNTADNQTFARLELPLSKNFVSVRDAIPPAK